MIMFKKGMLTNKRKRASKELAIVIEEPLAYSPPVLKTERDKVKYIKRCESIIRKSMEYKEYMKFLKLHMDMSKCTVVKNLATGDGRKYSIEIHHEPFTLFDIVDVVLNKRIQENLSTHELDIADEVMGLHYDEEIGLIPLSTTMHEAVHNDKIFIPLQLIYQQYDTFFNIYEPHMESRLIKKIEAKLKASLLHDNVASNSLDVKFTTIRIDGYTFPQIPEDWKTILTMKDEQ